MPGVIELTALIVSSVATSVVGANLLYLGTYALAYAGLAFGAQALQGLFVQKPSVPKPEDGSYNLKQAVPALSFALGRVKKASDYARSRRHMATPTTCWCPPVIVFTASSSTTCTTTR
ncbi:hypothetical protein [Ensifer canadensis]